MNLFGNKKEEHDAAQTNSIKVATSQETPQLNQNAPTPELSQNLNTAQNDFSNPFASQEAPSTPNPFEQPTQMPTETPNTSLNTQQLPSQTQQPAAVSPFGQERAELGASLVEKKQEIDMDKIQEMIDETVEKIIEERWEKVVNNVEKVVKWKDKVDNQMNLIKEDIVSMRDGFDELEKKLITKISNYDRNILDVNSEIKALEKVFQKITPTLVNNVNELSRIAEDLKTPQVKENKNNR